MTLLILLASLFFTAPVSSSVQVSDVQGQLHSPLELNGSRALVLVFIGVDCPISNGYAPEINRIIADYAGKQIDFDVVYADPTVTAEAARRHATAFKFACPALLDPRHLLVNKVHATLTPEAAVLGPDGKVLYLGRIDNLYAGFGKKRFAATQHDLRDALDAVLAGHRVPVAITPVVGCAI